MKDATQDLGQRWRYVKHKFLARLSWITSPALSSNRFSETGMGLMLVSGPMLVSSLCQLLRHEPICPNSRRREYTMDVGIHHHENKMVVA